MSASALISRQGFYVALYLGNQALAIATTIAIVRFGQDAFSLPWCLGVLIALGWGTTGYGLFDPSLAARVWSVPARKGSLAALRQTAISFVALGLVCVIPWSAGQISYLAGISIEWIAVFAAVGIVRGLAQVTNIFSLRLGHHAFALIPQIVGRIVEIGLVVLACLLKQAWLLIPALLAYPASQLLVFWVERRNYDRLPMSSNPNSSSLGWIVTVISRLLEMALPTIWLRFAGEQVFVAYKAISSALGHSILVPRYWFAIVSPNSKRKGDSLAIGGFVLVASVAMAGAFQFLTAAVPLQLFLWSLVPLTFNGLVMPQFSRWRQKLLLEGRVVPPAVVGVLACLVEAGLLGAITRFPWLPEGTFLIANIGFAAGFLMWLVFSFGIQRTTRAAG